MPVKKYAHGQKGRVNKMTKKLTMLMILDGYGYNAATECNAIYIAFIGILTAGHDDKKFIACIDDLNIVYGELTVKGDRNDCFHGSFIKKLSDFNICDLHGKFLHSVILLSVIFSDVYSIKCFCDEYSTKKRYFCEFQARMFMIH